MQLSLDNLEDLVWVWRQRIKACSILMAYATKRYVTHWTSSAWIVVVMLMNIRMSYQQGNNVLFEFLPFAQGIPYFMVLSVKVRDYGWLIILILCLDMAWGKPTFGTHDVGSIRHCNYMKAVRFFFCIRDDSSDQTKDLLNTKLVRLPLDRWSYLNCEGWFGDRQS
jgi:hypothetical protein